MDFSHPVQIAPHIYWVGQYLEDDAFQCHPYFIDNADQSILIDPGSMLEFDAILGKLEELSALKRIKYIILHHQDPDLCASVPALEKRIDREDLQVVTHSRMTVLIKHYGVTSAYYEIDRNDLRLETDTGLTLEFLTTPYCHSPGAFVTYEPSSRCLFSGDLFGGLEESWSFYAGDDYFNSVRGFHESYMPGKDILNYALRKIEKLDMALIAPQHGSIVREPLIQPLIEDMKTLDCGLYIDKQYHTEMLDVIGELEDSKRKLLRQEQFLQSVVDGMVAPVMVICKDYRVSLMNEAARRNIDEKFISDPDNPRCYEISHHRSSPCEGDNDPCPLKLAMEKRETVNVTHNHPTPDGEDCFVELSARPLMDENGKVYAIIETAHDITSHLKAQQQLSQQKALLYEQANRDLLTGLPNRAMLEDILKQALDRAAQDETLVGILFIDLDDFKPVNDCWGHHVGDKVLRKVAALLSSALRDGDTVARVGGDEFVVVIAGLRKSSFLQGIADKLISLFDRDIVVDECEARLGCSIGISVYPRDGEDCENLLKQADQAMYRAKAEGKNRYSFFSIESMA